MSSGFPGGLPDFFTAGGRSKTIPPQSQFPYRSPLTGILPDTAAQLLHRRPELIGKRSLAEFQLQQQQQQFLLHHHQRQQQQGLGLFNVRNVKPRLFQDVSPVSPLDFSAVSSMSSDFSSNSLVSNSSPANPRYGLPVLQRLRPETAFSGNSSISGGICSGNLVVQNRGNVGQDNIEQESEKKMMNKLQELEKQLLDDDEGGEDADAVTAAVTDSEWSETIQSLIVPTQKPISTSPTSSVSSCSSSSDPSPCPKQAVSEAAAAISEGKTEAAFEIVTRLSHFSNFRGTSEQRLAAYLCAALRSRLNQPLSTAELQSKEHVFSTQMLYEVSPCFKLGFMAANLAMLESLSEQSFSKIHVVDFDIGQGGQYMHFLHALAAKKTEQPTAVLKITAFADFVAGGEDRVKNVGSVLQTLANKVGVPLIFRINTLSKINDLSREKLGVESDECLAVNFAFRLYRFPDESVSTENLRDELLRRVKGLSPNVVTVVEQELNTNTAAFAARVNDAWNYYGPLFDSLDSTMPRDQPERVRIEEGLGRKIANSVACEGRDRVERCEVFGKWRARLSMAGFSPKPMSQLVAETLRSKLNSGTRGNPGFTVVEQNGGICFGWLGKTLTVGSAWR